LFVFVVEEYISVWPLSPRVFLESFAEHGLTNAEFLSSLFLWQDQQFGDIDKGRVVYFRHFFRFFCWPFGTLSAIFVAFRIGAISARRASSIFQLEFVAFESKKKNKNIRKGKKKKENKRLWVAVVIYGNA
jgi:hypothetical protein